MTLQTRTVVLAGETIPVPSVLCSAATFTGLTAPTLRAAITLVSSASDGGRIDMMKPRLERLINTRIDNGDRFLTRPAMSMIDLGDERPEADLWFDELDYTAGEQKRYAGKITGKLSWAARDLLAHPSYSRRVPVPSEVFGRLTTVGGILLYLRIASELMQQPNAGQITLRLDLDEARRIFGNYADGATLSRIGRVLVDPAVDDIAGAFPGFLVEAAAVAPAVHRQGRAWSHIEIVATRTIRRTIKQLMVEMAEREEYDRTKHDRPGSVKSSPRDPSNGKKPVINPAA